MTTHTTPEHPAIPSNSARYMGTACKCLLCGATDVYWRMGCRCWDVTKALKDNEYQSSLGMEYGYFVTFGTGLSYLSYDELIELADMGALYRGTGERIAANEFKDAS